MKFITIILIPALFLSACGDEHNTKQGLNAKSVDTLKVFSLKAEKLEKHISLPGELLPYERVEIRPKLNGYVKQLKVDIGSVVKKGHILLVVDAPEIQSQLGEGTGRMNAAKAKYLASLDTYGRILEASKTQGVISPNELQKAKNQMLADSAEYESQKFAFESYKQIGNYLAIAAPFNGVITERNVNIGSYVGSQSEKPVLVIEDNSKLRLRVAVPEVMTGVELKDNKVNFSAKAHPDKMFQATLFRKAGSIDARTRTEIWEFEVGNKKDILKAGSFADVTLTISRSEPSFAVPFSSVVTTLEKKFVIKVAGDSTQWVDVSQGLNLSEKTEIFGALNEGDTLILKANEEIQQHTRVFAKF